MARSYSVSFKGTTPKQLARKVRGIERATRTRLIKRPAKKSLAIVTRLMVEEMTDDLNVTKTKLKQKGGMVGKVIPRQHGATARITVYNRRIDLSDLRTRPRYKAGREAGLGRTYGGGTTYSIYKGETRTARNVWQRPSVVNSALNPNPTFYGGPDDYFTRSADNDGRFPIRKWRAAGTATWWTGKRGERALPGFALEVRGEVFDLLRTEGRHILGRPG